MPDRNVRIVPLVEPIPIADAFATGMAAVEYRGEYVRLIFFTERDLGNGEFERVLVARVVLPHVAFHTMTKKLTGCPLRLV